MFSRAKALAVIALAGAILESCTSANAPATHGDCGGGVTTGTGPC